MSIPAWFARTSLLITLFASFQATFSTASDAAGDEVLANAYGFGVDIAECPDLSKNIREIEIDQTTVDVREMTTGLDVEYRLFGPGATHWGQARFTSAVTLGGSKELKAWFDEASSGKSIRKNITVTLFKSDKTPGRSYNLFDCYPVQWSHGTDAWGLPVVTLTVEIGRVEFASAGRNAPQPSPREGNTGSRLAADATVSDKFAQVRGFKVEIDGAGGKEVDTAWESVAGGTMNIELNTGSDKFQTTSPGHKSVNTVVLRGAMTDKRAALCQWMNDTTTGRNWRRAPSFTEVLLDGADGETHLLSDAFPVRYKYPSLSVYNREGNMEESVQFVAVRDYPLLRGVRLARIDIGGAPTASRSAVLISLDDLNIDVHRLANEGNARRNRARVLISPGMAEELRAWMVMAEQGLAAARSVTVFLSTGDGAPPRTLNLLECLPVSFKTSSTAGVLEEVELKFIRVEIK